MKTYQITLDDDSAQLVDRMLQDGPWADVNELFLNGLGTLQEDIVAEAEMGLDFEDVKQKLREAEEDVLAGRVYDGEEVFSELFASLEETVEVGVS
jgi:hypothetical protein